MTASAPVAPGPLARLDLARDARTQFALPVLMCLVGAGLVILAVVAGLTAALPAAVAVLMAVLGIGIQVAGAGLALRIRSLRLAVEPDYLHLTGIGVDRRYHLAPGNLARVSSEGVTRPRRPSSLGRAVGKATLRTTGETIEVIQLGASPSVILVPTERGRVALAAAAEAELVDALMAAARTRAARPSPPPPEPTRGALAAPPRIAGQTVTAATAMAPAAPAAMPLPRPPEPAAPPRPLTGIERMELEERLALERRAAITGAQSEHAAASLTASAAAMTLPGRPATAFPPVAPPTPLAAAPSAAPAAIAPAAVPAAPSIATPAAVPAAPAAPSRTRAIPRALPRRRPQRPMARRVGPANLWPDVGLLGGPLAAAAIVWAMAVFVGSRPGAAGLDPIGFALLLCGPIAVLAAWLARSRWPRLAGLTSIAAVISLALVARSLIG